MEIDKLVKEVGENLDFNSSVRIGNLSLDSSLRLKEIFEGSSYLVERVVTILSIDAQGHETNDRTYDLYIRRNQNA